MGTALEEEEDSSTVAENTAQTSFEMQISAHINDDGLDDGDENGIFRSATPPSSFRNNNNNNNFVRIGVGLFLFSCLVYVVVDSMGERHIEAALLRFLEWVQLHPFRGALAVTLCYIVATILFIPGSILTLGAGFAIGSAFDNVAVGVLIATTAVFVGASLGSVGSFLLGRYLFRDCVYRLTESYPLFQAIDRALEGNGLKIMVLLRLSPLIPYNALDYMAGVTSIPLRDYSLALIALLPGALMLCFVGASASSLSDSTTSSNQTLKIVTIVSGLAFGGCGVYAASYYSKVELDRILQAHSDSNPIQNPASSSADSVEGAERLLPSSDSGMS